MVILQFILNWKPLSSLPSKDLINCPFSLYLLFYQISTLGQARLNSLRSECPLCYPAFVPLLLWDLMPRIPLPVLYACSRSLPGLESILIFPWSLPRGYEATGISLAWHLQHTRILDHLFWPLSLIAYVPRDTFYMLPLSLEKDCKRAQRECVWWGARDTAFNAKSLGSEPWLHQPPATWL